MDFSMLLDIRILSGVLVILALLSLFRLSRKLSTEIVAGIAEQKTISQEQNDTPIINIDGVVTI